MAELLKMKEKQLLLIEQPLNVLDKILLSGS